MKWEGWKSRVFLGMVVKCENQNIRTLDKTLGSSTTAEKGAASVCVASGLLTISLF